MLSYISRPLCRPPTGCSLSHQCGPGGVPKLQGVGKLFLAHTEHRELNALPAARVDWLPSERLDCPQSRA